MEKYKIKLTQEDGWLWAKYYLVKPNVAVDDLRSYMESEKENEGLKWWLKTFDQLEKAEFWLAEMNRKDGETVRVLVVHLRSLGDPWQKGGRPGPPPVVIPEIPKYDTFFERPLVKPGEDESLAFEVIQICRFSA